MEMFAYRVLFNKQTGEPYISGSPNPEDYESERLNFDNFVNSFISNFVMLAVDEWTVIMHTSFRRLQEPVSVLKTCF